MAVLFSSQVQSGLGWVLSQLLPSGLAHVLSPSTVEPLVSPWPPGQLWAGLNSRAEGNSHPVGRGRSGVP